MFNLTPQERRVILFLITMALVGMGINFLVKRNSLVKTFVCFAENNIGKVNLNKADKEDLMDIPGLGERLASRILEYRQQNGDFASLEDLKKIKGINDYRYEKLKNLCHVE